MTVAELIEELSGLNEESEIRFVYQSNYPLQDDIAGVWQKEEEECRACGGTGLTDPGAAGDGNPVPEDSECEECKGEGVFMLREAAGVAYIVSGGQNYKTPYGPAEAFENCR